MTLPENRSHLTQILYYWEIVHVLFSYDFYVLDFNFDHVVSNILR